MGLLDGNRWRKTLQTHFRTPAGKRSPGEAHRQQAEMWQTGRQPINVLLHRRQRQPPRSKQYLQPSSRARGKEAGSRIHKELKLIAKRQKRNDWRDNFSKRGYTDGQEMCREGPRTVSHWGNTSQKRGTWYRIPKRMTAAKEVEKRIWVLLVRM